MRDLVILLQIVLAFSLLVILLATVARMLPKRWVWPIVPSDPNAVPATDRMRATLEAAKALGYTLLGVFRYGPNRNFPIRYELWSAPAKDVLLIVGGGSVRNISEDVIWLLTQLKNGCCVSSTDNEDGSLHDLTGLIHETVYPWMNFNDLVTSHRKAVAAAEAPVAPYSDPLSNHLDLLNRMMRALVNSGYARFCGDTHESWRYTLKGAMVANFTSFWHTVRQAVQDKTTTVTDQVIHAAPATAPSPGKHARKRKATKRFIKTFLIWTAVLNLPGILMWIPLVRYLVFLAHLLWINIPASLCLWFTTLIGKTSYGIQLFGGSSGEFGMGPSTPLAWILVVVFWSSMAIVFTTITPIYVSAGKTKVQLHGDITVSGRTAVPWTHIYPMFLLHMLTFGFTGFLMAYSEKGPGLLFLYAHGGFAIVVYLLFYLTIFGRDEVKWMFINAGLGLLGIYSQINWLLSFMGKRFSDYPWYIHVIPFLYFIIYTFLVRHAVLDIMNARYDESRKKLVEKWYVAVSVAVYVISCFLERR
jgi:hypothetical protein